MTATEFKTRMGKASKSLKPFAIKLTEKIDDAHFFCENILFMLFMVHEKFSSGNSTVSSLYSVIMKALIPNYQEMLVDSSEYGYDDLYHVRLYKVESDDATEGRAKQTIETAKPMGLKPAVLSWSSSKYQKIVTALQFATHNFKTQLQHFQKDFQGQLELYKENFK